MLKFPLLLFKYGLIVAVIAGIAYGLSTSQITTVTCQLTTSPDQMCPDNLQSQLNQLQGQSLFFTNITSRVSTTDNPITITDIEKKLNGEVILHIAHYRSNETAPSDIQISGETSAINVEPVIASIQQHGLTVYSIRVVDASILLLQLPNDLQGIIEYQSQATQIEKLALIIKYLDLDAIDLNISEIDARYQLPVLRTTRTSF